MGLRGLIVFLIALAIAILSSCRQKPGAPSNPVLNAYDVEQNANDPQHPIPLSYQEAQGKRVFYDKCVWCHANESPAGPSNRSNLNPAPPLFTDGETFNALTDEFMQNTITLGGSAMGKSAMMPPWGQTLTREEIRAVIEFERKVAAPQYRAPARPTAQ
jgi:mono/diheme cytochrome c family protein